MASSDKEVEQQLIQAGNKLLNPPPSVDDLLLLLDQVENCLSKVEQSPTASMLSALAPSQKALIADQLFRHSDIDVKVAVASCISEITRITAPDAPYDDNEMKDIFQLIVSSFENLADMSSRSYGKRTSILETVAKVRSCVVMLDLECDALILEMFQHFLNTIRDNHPDNVFSSMETIMTLVLEESEEMSPKLISLLLASAKRGNEEFLPVARKLGEKVMEKCAAKVKPYLLHAMKSSGVSLDDYTDIVGSICQEKSETAKQNDHTADGDREGECQLVGVLSDEATQADAEIAPKESSPRQADPTNGNSPKSAMGNGVAQVGEADSSVHSSLLDKQDDGDRRLKDGDLPNKDEPDIVVTEKAVNEESKLEDLVKTSKQEVNSSTVLEEHSESHHTGNEDVKKFKDAKTPHQDIHSSSLKEVSTGPVSSENKRGADGIRPSSSKAQETESLVVTSPSRRGNLPGESLPKKSGRSKRKEISIKDMESSFDDLLAKTSEGTSDSEAKRKEHRKAPARISNEEKVSKETYVSEKESGPSPKELVEKPVKQPSKKVDLSSTNVDGSSNQSGDKNQRSRGKSIPEKIVTKMSTKNNVMEKDSSPKSVAKSTRDVCQLVLSPKTDTKKQHASNNKASEAEELETDLTGVRVKVWWPKDRKFYKGRISNYDPVKKKHTVTYDDGDLEILNLKRQRWEHIEDDSEQDEEATAEPRSPGVSSERPPKKKAKTVTDSSSKKGKTDATPGGGGSTSKSKNAETKSGQKPKTPDKSSEGKSSNDPNATKKAKENFIGKTKDNSKGGSKTTDSKAKKDTSTSKTARSNETPKASKSNQESMKMGISKQRTSKVTPSSMGKSPKSSKSSVNGTAKSKSGSLKGNEVEDKEDSTDSGEPLESRKGKSLGSSNRRGSEMKSGKKRRRA